MADLFDSELDAAEALAKKKFLRGAGAMAGVVLEKHLRQVCSNHSVKISKKAPTINDLNDLLKAAASWAGRCGFKSSRRTHSTDGFRSAV